MLLPPKTALGPITGTLNYDPNISGFEKIFRKYIMPVQFRISNFILSFRYTNLIFNTSNLKPILSKKVIDKSKFNFIYYLYEYIWIKTYIWNVDVLKLIIKKIIL